MLVLTIGKDSLSVEAERLFAWHYTGPFTELVADKEQISRDFQDLTLWVEPASR